MNEKTKAILLVTLIILALSGAFLYQGYVSYSNVIDSSIANRETEINTLIIDLEKFSFAPYLKRIDNMLLTNPEITETFASRDRERLFQLCLPRYEALKNENKFFHVMHFHLPDARTFLRMHKPEFFGDDLRLIRPIIDDVHAHHKSNSGFEIGRHGPFFRVVQPVFHENNYIGALEFGIRAHHILAVMENKANIRATPYFLKSHWNKATSIDHGKTIQYGDYIVLDHDNPLFHQLPADFNLNLDDQQVDINEKSFIVHVHPVFHDFQDSAIGGIMVFQDITESLVQKKTFLIRGLIFSAFLLLLALLVLYFTFGSLMDNLLHEVQERKKAEADLVQGQKRLQTIFDSAPAAIFIHDMNGAILDLNQTMLKMYGVEKEKGLALSITDDYSSRKNPLERAPVYWQKAAAGKPQQFEWLARRPNDGSTFTAQVNLEKILYGDQEMIYAMVQDISAKKEAEEKLASEQEMLAVTLRSIGDGVIATDIEGKVTFLNKVAENLTGWRNKEAFGKPSAEVFNIINEKTGQQCASPVEQALKTGINVDLANHTALIARDGTRRSIADSGAPIRDWESAIVGVVLVFRDIEQEQKMEKELLKIKKLESIGVLAGGIAHDFNNILTAILGNIELASFRLGTEDSKTTSLLTKAQKATLRAAKLTQQLLTFAKGGDPIRDTVILPELITESTDFVLHGSKVACAYTFPNDLWNVDIDSGQISQVIQNIVLNAKYAMLTGGIITIRCANVEDTAAESLLNLDKGNYVRITIQDSGIGIPAKIIDKIFDPYFSTREKGSGLGLAICHSIISKHDGAIKVESTPGTGTTFTIYLPAVFSKTVAADNPEESVPVQALRVMIMDDEAMLRDVAAAQLRVLGHEPFMTIDGEQAITLYQELRDQGAPIDLLIMDLTIPGGMGGQETAEQLLQIDPQAKIIVASGYSNDPVMADYKKYGFCAAVAKPFNLKDLSRVIGSVV